MNTHIDHNRYLNLQLLLVFSSSVSILNTYHNCTGVNKQAHSILYYTVELLIKKGQCIM